MSCAFAAVVLLGELQWFWVARSYKAAAAGARQQPAVSVHPSKVRAGLEGTS